MGISIGIGSTGLVITWYQIDTKICSIAHPYCQTHRLQSTPPRPAKISCLTVC